MQVNEVISYFGSTRETAQALGVTFQAIHRWSKQNKVPQGRQWQIQTLTGGRLVVDKELHERTAV